MQFSAPRVWRARSRSLLPGGFSPPEARLGTPLLSCVNLWPGNFPASYHYSVVLPSYYVSCLISVTGDAIFLSSTAEPGKTVEKGKVLVKIKHSPRTGVPFFSS